MRKCDVCGGAFDSFDNYMSLKVSVPAEDYSQLFYIHREPCSEEVKVEGIL